MMRAVFAAAMRSTNTTTMGMKQILSLTDMLSTFFPSNYFRLTNMQYVHCRELMVKIVLCGCHSFRCICQCVSETSPVDDSSRLTFTSHHMIAGNHLYPKAAMFTCK